MEKRWRVSSVRDRGPEHFYRYSVEGVNIETGVSFSWSVPRLGDGYDLSNAVWKHARDAFWKNQK
jgi:hypothetical protein